MPSCTKEQKAHALEALEEREGRVTPAITKLGYPSRQTMCQRIDGACAARARTAGRPFSHHDPQLKEDAVRLARGCLDAKDVARHLGVSGAAAVYNWARTAEKEGMPMGDEPAKASGDEPAWSGFDGEPEGKIRQLQLENDISRGVVEALKAASPGSLANREKVLALEHLRQATGRSLEELADSLRISKSSYECQRGSIAREDKYGRARARVVELFEAASRTRGYRCITRKLREGGDPIVISEKVVRRLMREEGCRVIYLKKARKYSSYAGEISDAPENLVKRGCHYRWPGWIAICEENGLVRSMSKKGCSPDDSAMEGFFGRLKNEFFFHRDWHGVTMGEFMSTLDAYLRFYNEGRIKESLGWMSPMQCRRSLGLAA